MMYLILSTLLLVEVLLVVAGVLLYRRYGGGRATPSAEDRAVGHAERLIGFVRFEIRRMEGILKDLPEAHPDRPVIEKRLSVFNNELAIFTAVRADPKASEYHQLIIDYYRGADLSRTPDFDRLHSAVLKYQERIADLEQYRSLFFRGQKDLGDAINRVVELKRRLDDEALNEEQQAQLIAELKQERDRLSEELNIADHELEAIMGNIDSGVDTSLGDELPSAEEITMLMEQMRAIEEENDFLQAQIQHLLKAELAQDQQQRSEIVRLEQALADQHARYEELESKFMDMEARYLQAVG